jgi:nucleotide-binding universal stress UspA family protein
MYFYDSLHENQKKTMKRKKILVPIDFTEVSILGLKTSVEIATQIKADLNLLHIIRDHSNVGFQAIADMQASAKQVSEQEHFMIEWIKKRSKDLKDLMDQHRSSALIMNPFLEFGSFTDQFKKHLKDNPPDLVVMGTSGETSFSEFFTGNHATKAIRIADVPVLAVKEYIPLMNMDKILILVSLKKYDKQKVGLIKKFAGLLDLKVLVGHVKEYKDLVKDDIYSELQKFARDNDLQNGEIQIIGKGEKVEAVQHFVEQNDVKIIASISEGDKGLVRMIFGSDTEQFLNKIDKPLLAVSE